MFAHLAGNVRDDLVTVVELDSKLRVGKGLHDLALNHECFFLRHLHNTPQRDIICAPTNNTLIRAGSIGQWEYWKNVQESCASIEFQDARQIHGSDAIFFVASTNSDTNPMRAKTAAQAKNTAL